MIAIADKLADVTRRIAETESHIAAQRARIEDGRCFDGSLSVIMLESSQATLAGLRSYKARLEDLMVVNARARRPR